MGAALCSKVHSSPSLWPLSDSGLEPIAISALKYKDSPRIYGLSELKKSIRGHHQAFANEFYQSWKGPTGENIGIEFLRLMSIFPPQIKDLVFHPGIVTRQEKFFKFLFLRPGLTAAQALVQFREHLGYKTYYRALVLDQPIAETIRKKEINVLSSGLSRYPESKQVRQSYNLVSEIVGQMNQSKGQLPISVTAYPEVAIAVGQAVKKGWELSGQVYLLTLKLPVLDTLDYTFILPPGASMTITKNSEPVLKNLPLDHRLESFVLFAIDKREVTSIEPVDPRDDYRYFTEGPRL